jgi:hypothetical protein
LPAKVDTAEPPSYRPDDAPRSPVKLRKRAAADRRSPDFDQEEERKRQFAEMAGRWMTADDIAAVLGLERAGLDAWCRQAFDMTTAQAVKRFRAGARDALLKKQWEHVENGSVAMAIFLGKNYLDQSDNPKQAESRPPVSIVVMPATMNPTEWQRQMAELEASREERIRKAMEATGRFLEDKESDVIELPASSVSNRSV